LHAAIQSCSRLAFSALPLGQRVRAGVVVGLDSGVLVLVRCDRRVVCAHRRVVGLSSDAAADLRVLLSTDCEIRRALRGRLRRGRRLLRGPSRRRRVPRRVLRLGGGACAALAASRHTGRLVRPRLRRPSLFGVLVRTEAAAWRRTRSGSPSPRSPLPAQPAPDQRVVGLRVWSRCARRTGRLRN